VKKDYDLIIIELPPQTDFRADRRCVPRKSPWSWCPSKPEFIGDHRAGRLPGKGRSRHFRDDNEDHQIDIAGVVFQSFFRPYFLWARGTAKDRSRR